VKLQRVASEAIEAVK